MKKIQKIINIIRLSRKNLPAGSKAEGVGLYYSSQRQGYGAALPVGFKSRAKSDYFYR